MKTLGMHVKVGLDTIPNCKDATSKPNKQNNIGMDSSGINLELILDTNFEVVERNKFLLARSLKVMWSIMIAQ